MTKSIASYRVVFGLCLVASAVNLSCAQDGSESSGATESQASLPLPDVEMPARDFATAEAHYQYLLEQADGGTIHTMATIPVWDGLWGSGNNTMPSRYFSSMASKALDS